MTYNSLQHIFTNMIGFVTWPPFFVPKCYKGGQVTYAHEKVCDENERNKQTKKQEKK